MTVTTALRMAETIELASERDEARIRRQARQARGDRRAARRQRPAVTAAA